MDFSKLTKVEKRTLRPAQTRPDQILSGIVKVRLKGYYPRGVVVRSTMGDRVFTADFLAGDLPSIQADPNVEAVSISQPLPLQKQP